MHWTMVVDMKLAVVTTTFPSTDLNWHPRVGLSMKDVPLMMTFDPPTVEKNVGVAKRSFGFAW